MALATSRAGDGRRGGNDGDGKQGKGEGEGEGDPFQVLLLRESILAFRV